MLDSLPIVLSQNDRQSQAMFQLISRVPKGPLAYFLHGPAHSIRLLWFPIGFNGPYAMRPFYVAYYLHFKPSGIS